MRSIRKTELGREENHLVNAAIKVNGEEIQNVPCKIYLPERIEEKPSIVLKPSKEDFKRISLSNAPALKAIVCSLDNKNELVIEAPEVHLSGRSSKYWSTEISDNTINGEPQDLHVMRQYKESSDLKNTKITFWISPNPYLTPSLSSSSSYTGEVEYKRVRKIELTMNNQVNLSFDKHFRSKWDENGDFIQWSFLVARTELDISADDVEIVKKDVLPDIDDFLLIASFAARQRTACLGWSAIDKNSETKFYRGNYSFPNVENDKTISDGLIDIQQFERFMQTAYPAFLAFENKLALRNALYSILPTKPIALETSFLNDFAGLETLVLDFRRRKALEFVLKESDWNTFRKYLIKCIKDSTEPKLEKEQRKSIYKKLSELNRISLREAFNKFCNEYSIDLSDLWPVFGDGKLAGLVDIRNKIVHGDPFPQEMMGKLLVAKINLTYILERVLTRVLQWDVAETKNNPTYMSQHIRAVQIKSSEQFLLSKYLNSLVPSKKE